MNLWGITLILFKPSYLCFRLNRYESQKVKCQE